jgi:beta-phosphoglucomutase-like phosphatase (HAD superfamily)
MSQTQVAVREPSMSIDAVVFDLDGLMLDTEGIYRNVWQHAARELGFGLDDRCYARMIGRTVEDCERDLLDQFGSDFPLARFRVRWHQLWRAATDGGISAKPGLSELLDFIEIHGCTAAVATSSHADFAHFSIRQAGFEGRFGVVVTADHVARGKPAPDLYLEAAHRLGVEPGHCVALEDSEAGIMAANGAGMTTILVPDLAIPSRATFEIASFIRSSLDEARKLLAVLLAHELPRDPDRADSRHVEPQ